MIITADGALVFGIRLAGRGTLFCLLYSAQRLHKLCPMLSRRHSGVSELAQFTFYKLIWNNNINPFW
jgi:hypothetical protein